MRRWWSAVLWPHTKALPREAPDDNRGATENHPGGLESDRRRRAAGIVAGKRFEEGTVLWRFPARSHERGSRCPAAALSEDAAATGSPALREDIRSVRLRLPALD